MKLATKLRKLGACQGFSGSSLNRTPTVLREPSSRPFGSSEFDFLSGVCQGFYRSSVIGSSIVLREASNGIFGSSKFGFSVGQSRKYSTETKPESDTPDTPNLSVNDLIQKTDSPVSHIPTDRVIFISANASVPSECGIGIIARDLESGELYFWRSFYKLCVKEANKYDSAYHALESIEDALKCCLENGLASHKIVLMNDNENAVDFTMMARVPESYRGVCKRIELLKLQFEKPVRIIHKITRLINSVKYLSKFEPLKEKKTLKKFKEAIKMERKRFPVTSAELSIYGQCRK